MPIIPEYQYINGYAQAGVWVERGALSSQLAENGWSGSGGASTDAFRTNLTAVSSLVSSRVSKNMERLTPSTTTAMSKAYSPRVEG